MNLHILILGEKIISFVVKTQYDFFNFHFFPKEKKNLAHKNELHFVFTKD